MKDFAKLFTTPYGQVLVTIDDAYDDGEGETLYPVTVRCAEYRELSTAVAAGYKTEEAAQAFFDEFDDAEALKAVEQVRGMLDRMLGGAAAEEASDA